MTERKLQRNRRGFTLTEVPLALAILIILAGAGHNPYQPPPAQHPPVGAGFQGGDHLSGGSEPFLPAAGQRPQRRVRQGPGHGPEQHPLGRRSRAKYTTSTLNYVTSAAKQSTLLRRRESILPREQVEGELWDANWLSSMTPAGGCLRRVLQRKAHGVTAFDAFNPCALRDRWVQEGATVGYHGGDSVQSEDI